MNKDNLEEYFVSALRDALMLEGLEVVSGFRIPGTTYRIDLFVPSVPRAEIEVKTKFSQEDLKTAIEHQDSFAGRLVVFFVSLEPTPPNVISEAKNNPYINYLFRDPERITIDEFLSETVKQINLNLANLRLKEWSLMSWLKEGKKLSPKASNQIVVQLPPIGSSIPPHPPLEYDILADIPMMDAYEPSPKEEMPIGEDLTQSTQTLLRAFQDLVPSDRYLVLEHELSQLVAEFEQRHFTSCSLRAGRALEFIVYCLAKAWNVRLDDPVYNLVDDMQRRLQKLNTSILEYREAEDRDRETKRSNVQRQGSDFAAKINTLGFLLDDKKLQPSTVPPRNIEAILRDIGRTYARYQKVRDLLNEIINDGLARKILSIRNKAAHADLEGKHREVSKDEVLKMLEAVHILVYKLSLVGDVIRSKNPRDSSK